jgi:hypothetical protein
MLNGSEYRLVKENVEKLLLVDFVLDERNFVLVTLGTQTNRPFSDAVIEGKQREAQQRRL